MRTNDHFHKNKIRQCFNRAALTYNQYSYPQQIIGSKLIDHVYQCLPEPDLIIDLGCGTGIITEKLISTLNYKKIYAVDISDGLIAQAEKRLSHCNAHIFNVDYDSLPFKDQLFHLAFSNMALHWSIAFPKTLLRINKNILENGMLAFTVPLTGTFSELATISKNNFYGLEDIPQHLVDAGFEPIECFSESLVFKFDSWIKAIKSIKTTGANYLFNREKKSLTSKSLFYSSSNSESHFIKAASLTYQVGYFIARKKFHVF